MGQMKQRSDYKVGDGYLITVIKKQRKITSNWCKWVPRTAV